MILLKVSFSRSLFEKELRKAYKLVLPLDLAEFREWCYQQFSRLYRRVLKRVFGNPQALLMGPGYPAAL